MTDSRQQACGCCDGTGEVPDIDRNPRPCSRCRADDFSAWYNARRPTAAENADKPASKAGNSDDGSAA